MIRKSWHRFLNFSIGPRICGKIFNAKFWPRFAQLFIFLSAGKASPEKCSSGSSDGSVENVAAAKNDVDDESGDDEFQDEIHFDPTISSGHLGFRDVRP